MTEEALNINLAQDIHGIVISPEYQLAPENPYPAGLNDCYAALLWMAAHAAECGIDPERICVNGASAGAALAVGCVIRARNENSPAECSPSMLKDYEGMPPTFISQGSVDIFRDEAIAFASNLMRAGVETNSSNADTGAVTMSIDVSNVTGGRIIIDQDVMVEMRDGTKLACDVYRLNDGQKHPVLLEKSPYDNKQFTGIHNMIISPYVCAMKGYAVVVMEDRGREKSEGYWRPFIDDAQDTYDAIDWCSKQEWGTGEVGMYGNCGYGYETFTALTLGHPALKAVFAHTSCPNPYDGWTYNNGIYHLAFMSAWSSVQGMNTAVHNNLLTSQEDFGNFYGAFLRHYQSGMHRPPKPSDAHGANPDWLPLKDAETLGRLNYWQEWLEHPMYDDFWKASDNVAKLKLMTEIDVPVCQVTGWYDNAAQGNIDVFEILLANSTDRVKKEHRLVMGPWDHSAYYNGRPSCAGERDFGIENDTGMTLSVPLFFGWFDKHLKGVGQGVNPGENQIKYFQLGENAWKEAPVWPIDHENLKYYLHSAGSANSLYGDGTLSTKEPQSETADTYVYDPLDPTLSYGGRSMLYCTGIWNQEEAEKKDNMLVYTTRELTEDLAISGPVRLELYASSDCEDTDFHVKVVDVEPDGYCMNVTEGQIRCRYRNGCDHEEFLEPGKEYKFDIRIFDIAHTFKAGHKLRVTITGSDFPNFSRNLNVRTAPEQASKEEAKIATQTVYHDAARPSAIILPVIS